MELKSLSDNISILIDEVMCLRKAVTQLEMSQVQHCRDAVFRALSSPNQIWVTSAEISKYADLDIHIVKKVIDEYSDEIVEHSRVSELGLPLFTTRERYHNEVSFQDKLIGAFVYRAI
ncbi:MAG: hypothetical protein AABY07_08840 [Nanoarchaeota archaeon]